MTAAAEAAKDNDNPRESDLAMATAAIDDNNSDCCSRGDDDIGSGNESDSGKKITFN
jgi:hypothetical protein